MDPAPKPKTSITKTYVYLGFGERLNQTQGLARDVQYRKIVQELAWRLSWFKESPNVPPQIIVGCQDLVCRLYIAKLQSKVLTPSHQYFGHKIFRTKYYFRHKFFYSKLFEAQIFFDPKSFLKNILLDQKKIRTQNLISFHQSYKNIEVLVWLKS